MSQTLPISEKKSPRTALWSVLMFGVVSCLAGGGFWVSQSASEYEREIQSMNRKLANERQAIRVLNAEWAYLSRPQRIETLMVVQRENTPEAQPVNATSVANAISRASTNAPSPSLESKHTDTPITNASTPSNNLVTAPHAEAVVAPAIAPTPTPTPISAPTPAPVPTPVATPPAPKAAPLREAAPIRAEAAIRQAKAPTATNLVQKNTQKDIDVWPIEPRRAIKPAVEKKTMYRPAAAQGQMRPILE